MIKNSLLSFFTILTAININAQINFGEPRDIHEFKDFIVITYYNEMCSKIVKATGEEELIFDLSSFGEKKTWSVKYILKEAVIASEKLLVKRLSDKQLLFYDLHTNDYTPVFKDASVGASKPYWKINKTGNYMLYWENDTVTYYDISNNSLNTFPIKNTDIDENEILDLDLSKKEILFKYNWGQGKHFYKYNYETNALTSFVDAYNYSELGDFVTYGANYVNREPTKIVVYNKVTGTSKNYALPKLLNMSVNGNSRDGKSPTFYGGNKSYIWNAATGKFDVHAHSGLESHAHPNEILVSTGDKELGYYNFKTRKIGKTFKFGNPTNMNSVLPCKTTIVKNAPISLLQQKALSSAEAGRFTLPAPVSNAVKEVETHYGDVNFDGKSDVVVEYVGWDYFDILLGDGKKGYSGYIRYKTPYSKRSVEVIDQEIVVHGSGDRNETHFIYDNDKNVFNVLEYTFSSLKEVNPACQCFKHDGKTDTLYLELEKTVSLPKIDFNRDGIEDQVGGYKSKITPQSGDTYVLDHPNDEYSVGVTINGKNKGWKLPAKAFTVQTGDFDGDGLLDFVVGSDKFKGFYFYFNNGNGVEFTEKKIETDYVDHYHFEVEDFDDDGLSEIAIKEMANFHFIGCDKARNLKVKYEQRGVQLAGFSYKTFYDMNFDGVLDYLSIDYVEKSDGVHYRFTPYLGYKKDGVYQLNGYLDIFHDAELYKAHLASLPKPTVAPKPRYKSTYTEMITCGRCKGKGKIYGSGMVACRFCSGGGSYASSCGWCGGGGQNHSYYYQNGHLQSNTTSCSKCNGGSSGGVGCYACKGKGNVYQSGNQTCPECRGWRLFYVQKEVEK